MIRKVRSWFPSLRRRRFMAVPLVSMLSLILSLLTSCGGRGSGGESNQAVSLAGIVRGILPVTSEPTPGTLLLTVVGNEATRLSVEDLDNGQTADMTGTVDLSQGGTIRSIDGSLRFNVDRYNNFGEIGGTWSNQVLGTSGVWRVFTPQGYTGRIFTTQGTIASSARITHSEAIPSHIMEIGLPLF